MKNLNIIKDSAEHLLTIINDILDISKIESGKVSLQNNIFNPKELILKLNSTLLTKEKYNIPKYAMKMATGTGKTWVMNALFIWQYLNARAEKQISGRYSKNFLLIAPGLIVYERLLDSK